MSVTNNQNVQTVMKPPPNIYMNEWVEWGKEENGGNNEN